MRVGKQTFGPVICPRSPIGPAPTLSPALIPYQGLSGDLCRLPPHRGMPGYKELHVEIGDLSKLGAWDHAIKRTTREALISRLAPIWSAFFTGPAAEMSVARPGAFYTYPLDARL